MGIQPIDPIKVLEQLVVSAEACVQKESWYAAAQLTDKANTLASRKNLSKAKSVGSFQKRVEKLYEQLDSEARRRLQVCQQYYQEKKYAEALGGYRTIVNYFSRRPCAAEARKALAEAAADPERKRLLDQIQAKEMEQRIDELIEHPERIPGVASSAVSPKAAAAKTAVSGAAAGTRVDKIKALPVVAQARIVCDLEKLAKSYSAFPQGERAAGDLKALRADKTFQGALDKHQNAQRARGLLSLAQAYRGIGKHDKAAGFCNQLIKEFPDTDLAAKARDMLDDIELRAP